VIGGSKRKFDFCWLGNLSLLSVLVMVLLGQSLAQKITVEFDQGANFSSYKTYSFLKGQLNSNNPALNNDLVKKQIEADIDQSLMAKGLTKDDNSPDLHVVYTLGSGRETELESYPAGWRGWGTRVVRVPYTEGTLVINLRDHHTHSLVWRGIARQDTDDATKIEGKLGEMVKKTLAKYPPKAK
jgi:hypothetical protein